MICYHPAGQDFYFPCPVPELVLFEVSDTQPGTAEQAVPFIPHSFIKNESGISLPVPAPPALVCQTVGWVGGAQRRVEVFDISPGLLLKVEGGGDFFIAPRGETIGKSNPQEQLSPLDRAIVVGPALVLALALRGTWSLHASAAIFNDNLIVFLGESGLGKSSLAASLADQAGWRLAADDILPVTAGPTGVEAWPHFPQLKLSIQDQPWPGLMENIPIRMICLLETTSRRKTPELRRLSLAGATQTRLSRTAGTRLFAPDLLSRHLDFCTGSAVQVPVYRLTYPHCWEALPRIKELLEHIC